MLDFSDILMGFVDLFPVVLFLLAAINLQRCLYNKMSKGAFAVFSAGTIVVFVSGLLKAIYKILLTFRICDFAVLSTCFFPMQTVGFVLAGAGIAAVLVYDQGKNVAYCSTLPLIIALAYNANYDDVTPFSGTMVFVVFMCLGVIIMDGGLISIALKMKKPIIAVLLVVAIIFTLGMGYLSTKDGMNDWVKEFVNTIGQGSLLAASILFKKNGLEESTMSLKLGK